MARASESELRKEAEDNADLANLLREKAETNEAKTLLLADQLRLRSYVSDMKAAQVDLDQNNLQRTRWLLERYIPKPGQPDLRDLAWRYLWHRSRSDESASWKPHDGNTVSITYSPDGRFMATVGFDQKIKIWNAVQRNLIKILDTDYVPSWFVEPNTRPFSSDGSLFAHISGGQLEIYRTSDWSIAHTLGEVKHPIIFSRKGRTVSARIGQQIQIWNLQSDTQKTISPSDYHPGRPLAWDFSPNGEWLVEGNSEKSPTIWDLKSMTPIRDLDSEYSYNLIFSPSGDLIAEAGSDSMLRLWDSNTGKLVAETLESPSSNFFGLAFSPDETMVVATGNDQLVQVYSVPDLTHLKSLRGHVNEVWKAAFNPDGTQLATAGKEEHVRFWNISKEWAAETTAKGNQGPKLYWHYDSGNGSYQLLDSKADDGYLQFWDIQNGKLVPIVRYKTRGASTTFSKDLSMGATSPGSGALELFKIPSGNKVHSIEIQHATLYPGRFSPDGKLLTIRARFPDHWELVIYDITTFREVTRMEACEHSNHLLRPPFSPNGSLLAIPQKDLSFRIWDVHQQKETGILSGHRWNLYNCNFSPDGKLFATSSIDGEARIWNIETMQLEVPPLIGHVRGVKRLAWTPDSKVLLSSGDDKSLRIWNVALGQEMICIQNARGPLIADEGNTLAFHAEDEHGKDYFEIIQLPTLEEIDRTEDRK